MVVMRTNATTVAESTMRLRQPVPLLTLIRLNTVVLILVWLVALYGAYSIGQSLVLTALVGASGVAMLLLLWGCSWLAIRARN